MVHLLNIMCASLWILGLLGQMTAAPTENPRSTTTTQPVIDHKAAPSEEAENTADKGAVGGNGNVYGADPAANAVGGTQADQANKPRGFNQGYSYNTGIKPYRTGYTYFQPFGDAADQQNQQGQGGHAVPAAPKAGHTGGAAVKPGAKALPVPLPNFFGIDPKAMGPVRVIPNQNVPVDENGIPNLDAIKIPEDNGNGGKAMAAPAPVPIAVQPQQAQNINPQDFSIGNDFNLNQILGGGGVQPQPQQQQAAVNPANDNSMFDFAPPSAQNFDLSNNGGDGNLPMLDNQGGGGGGGNTGDGFGFGGGQQTPVPSEISNLNNAFGANTNQASNNDMMNILNQLNGGNGGGGGGGGGAQQGGGGNEMDFGNFGNAATNRNQFFPFF